MNIPQYIDYLHKVISGDYRLNWINHGGCCVFASHVVKRLQKLGYDASIIVLGYEDALEIDEVIHKVENPKDIYDWNDNGIDFVHVIVSVWENGKEYLFDSDEVWQDERALIQRYNDERKIIGDISLEVACALAGSRKGWNRCFERELIPVLRGKIERATKKLEPISKP